MATTKERTSKRVTKFVVAAAEPLWERVVEWLSRFFPDFLRTDTAKSILAVLQRQGEDLAEKMEGPLGPILERAMDITIRASGEGKDKKEKVDSGGSEWKKKVHDKGINDILQSDNPQDAAKKMKGVFEAAKGFHETVYPQEPPKADSKTWEEVKPSIEEADLRIASRIQDFRKSQNWLRPKKNRGKQLVTNNEQGENNEYL